MKLKTIALYCTCENKGQDNIYGQGMRLHVEKATVHIPEAIADKLKEGKIKENSLPDAQYRCTVCGSVKSTKHGKVIFATRREY